MKKVLLISLVLVLGLAVNVLADIIPVDPMYWIGSRSTPDTSGVIAADGWTDTNGGFTISWAITFDPTQIFPYKYTYSITADGGSALVKALSHWIFEVSNNDDVTGLNFSSSAGTWGSIGEPGYYAISGSNPNMPAAGIYGIKFDGAGPTFTFHSTQAPMWGDFYAKDGTDKGIWATAWNTGFGFDPTTSTINFANWIAVPDTEGFYVPEPSTLLLVGGGLLGLGLYGRRKFRK